MYLDIPTLGFPFYKEQILNKKRTVAHFALPRMYQNDITSTSACGYFVVGDLILIVDDETKRTTSRVNILSDYKQNNELPATELTTRIIRVEHAFCCPAVLTKVDIVRLQDVVDGDLEKLACAKDEYIARWDKLYPSDFAYDKNPLVWRIEFNYELSDEDISKFQPFNIEEDLNPYINFEETENEIIKSTAEAIRLQTDKELIDQLNECAKNAVSTAVAGEPTQNIAPKQTELTLEQINILLNKYNADAVDDPEEELDLIPELLVLAKEALEARRKLTE